MLMILAWAGAVLGPPATWWAWRRKARGGSAWALLAVFATVYGLGVWAFLVEPQLLVVRHVAVQSAAWRGPPLRIGVLSDTHVDAPHVDPPRLREVVRRLSAERPDLVLFAGDYVGGHAPSTMRSPEARAEIEAGLATFREARAPLGRVAVLGNHDWWYDGPLVEAGLRRAGLPVLENHALRVARPSGGFWVAGVADFHSERTEPSVAAALRDVTTDEPVLLLSHWPDIFTNVPPRVALTVAAHTHCGQVNLPFLGRPVLPSAGSRRWPCGLYDDGGRKLLVTGGLGVSMLPVRFRAPPEIVIVTLSGRP